MKLYLLTYNLMPDEIFKFDDKGATIYQRFFLSHSAASDYYYSVLKHNPNSDLWKKFAVIQVSLAKEQLCELINNLDPNVSTNLNIKVEDIIYHDPKI